MNDQLKRRDEGADDSLPTGSGQARDKNPTQQRVEQKLRDEQAKNNSGKTNKDTVQKKTRPSDLFNGA